MPTKSTDRAAKAAEKEKRDAYALATGPALSEAHLHLRIALSHYARRMIIAKNNLDDAERAPIAAERRAAIDDERAAIRSDLAAMRRELAIVQRVFEEIRSGVRSGAPTPKLDDLVKQLDNLTNATKKMS
jgi:hypothetical protein